MNKKKCNAQITTSTLREAQEINFLKVISDYEYKKISDKSKKMLIDLYGLEILEKIK